MFLSCHVRVSEWIYFLYLHDCQGTPCSKQARYLSLSDCNGTLTQNHLVRKRTLNHLAKLSKWLSWIMSTYLYHAIDCIFLSCHVRVSEWIHTLYLLVVKELLARNTRNIQSLSDCNGSRTHNKLVRRRTLSHLAKRTKWLSWIVSTCLYGAIDCMFLPCRVRVSEWICTLYLPDCQGTPCSKQVRCLKFKWLQRNLDPQALSS